MSKERLKCTEADCDRVTEEAEFEEAEYYMDKHVKLHHAPVQPTMQTTLATLPESRPQAERVKRPSLSFSGSTLEVEEFELRHDIKLQCTMTDCSWTSREEELEVAEESLASHLQEHLQSIPVCHGHNNQPVQHQSMASLPEDKVELVDVQCIVRECLWMEKVSPNSFLI